jgi:hypothetical protein
VWSRRPSDGKGGGGERAGDGRRKGRRGEEERREGRRGGRDRSMRRGEDKMPAVEERISVRRLVVVEWIRERNYILRVQF